MTRQTTKRALRALEEERQRRTTFHRVKQVIGLLTCAGLIVSIVTIAGLAASVEQELIALRDAVRTSILILLGMAGVTVICWLAEKLDDEDRLDELEARIARLEHRKDI